MGSYAAYSVQSPLKRKDPYTALDHELLDNQEDQTSMSYNNKQRILED